MVCYLEYNLYRGELWLSGRASDSGARGLGFQTYLRRVVSLSKTLYSTKVLVIPRNQWLRPDMTEKLLTLNLNTNKQTKLLIKIVNCLFAKSFLINNKQCIYPGIQFSLPCMPLDNLSWVPYCSFGPLNAKQSCPQNLIGLHYSSIDPI